jgi:hypothetical protein
VIRGALTGKRYGLLTVEGVQAQDRYWCRCDCGQRTVVWGSNLRDGRTTSCGDHRRHQVLLGQLVAYRDMSRTRYIR